MINRKIITITAWKRPQYVKQVLGALSRCYNIHDYLLIACIEPIQDNCHYNDELVKLFEDINFCDKIIIKNRDRLASANAYSALTKGFAMGDYVILLDDDHVLSKDALLYFEYCNKEFKNDIHCFGACAYSREANYLLDNENVKYHIVKLNFFTNGFATWKDRWEELGGMRDTWDFEQVTGGYDFKINLIRNNRYMIHPVLSRIQNIGKEDGFHNASIDFFNDYVHLNQWADDYNLENNIDQYEKSWVTLKQNIILDFDISKQYNCKFKSYRYGDNGTILYFLNEHIDPVLQLSISEGYFILDMHCYPDNWQHIKTNILCLNTSNVNIINGRIFLNDLFVEYQFDRMSEVKYLSNYYSKCPEYSARNSSLNILQG